MKTKYLPLVLVVLLFACEEDEKDIFSGKWSYESTQTDLKVNFELWKIRNEATYRIKYTSVAFGQTELPPTNITITGSEVLSITITGVGYELLMNDCTITDGDMRADIDLQYTQEVALQDQILKKVR